jgi:cyclohexanecarboxyl-CoA dehydrogenase
MDFTFTEDQELFRKNLRAAVERDIAPGYMERSKIVGFNRAMLKKLGQMGLLGFGIPEEYGGQEDIDPLTMGIIVEELGRGDMVYAMAFIMATLGAQTMYKNGPEAIKKEWLPEMVKGNRFCAFCFTEPGSGTDLASLSATAVKEGDSYIIDGTKTSISFNDADAHFIAAKTDPNAGFKGISLFFIPANMEGIQRSYFTDLGLKQVGRGEISYKDVRVPTENMVGEAGKGFYDVMGVFDLGRPCICLMSLACAEVALEKAMNYAKQRVAFGRTISKFEAISFGFAEHYTYIEGARLIAYKSLFKRGIGQPNVKESSMAKWYGCSTAFDAIHFAIGVLGNLGYTSEYDAGQRLMDVLGWAFGDGTFEAQKMVIAREIGGREFLPY